MTTTAETNPYAKAVGANVSAELSRRGMTRAALAQSLHVDPAWVTRRLRATVPLNMEEIDRIAHVLDLAPEVLTRTARA